MGAVRQLADRYLDELCRLDPILGSSLGLVESATSLPDLSPDGAAARAALASATLRRLADLTDDDPDDRACRALLADRLGVVLDSFAAGEHLRPLSVIGSPVGAVRSVFDNMPRSTADDWERIATRAEGVADAYGSLRRSLEAGLAGDLLAAPRQALAGAQQLATWAGEEGRRPWFLALADAAPPSVQPRLAAAAGTATDAMRDLAAWLRTDYAAAAASVPDAAGPDRYALKVRQFLGARLDTDEAYAWAWDELMRIETEMAAVADEILPGAGLSETMAHLDRHGDAAEGDDALRDWLQALMDDTVAALQGTHFDLPPGIRHVEAMIAPPGTAAAQYYTAPSADLSRPGRTWYPTLGRSRFPLWAEVSTCFHEGVPGHHMQLGTWAARSNELSRFQTYTYVSGNIEGWALYSERLMDELGFLRSPAERLGYLVAQQLRAARVVVDIGMHLELRLPGGQPLRPGERWTPELGLEFLHAHAGKDTEFLQSEWVRYLGWPAQAICYKLGERVWLAARDEARAAAAAVARPFDQRAWHTAALGMGSVGLDGLPGELRARFTP